MIKETVNEYRFRDVLLADEYAGWSYGATKALYDYYDQLSEDMDEDIELDRVAIRCEWSEYSTALEYAKQHHDFIPCEESDERDEEVAREWLKERTTVLDVENLDTSADTYRTIKSILVMQF